MPAEIAERISDFLQTFLQWGSRRPIEDERFRALMREADALLWDVQAPDKEKPRQDEPGGA